MTDVRYQFFVSSTYDDLRPERQQVIEAILELGHIPVGMEVFPSAEDSPWEIVKRTISQSDYYVVLSAGRYGSCDVDGVSFTEREFDFATELGMPIVGFLAARPFDRAELFRDDDTTARAKLSAFHAKIRTRHIRTWNSPSDLGLQTSKAIINVVAAYPRVGWIKADKAKSIEDFEQIEALREELVEHEEEATQLRKQVSELQTLISSTVLPHDEIQPDLLSQGDDITSVVFKATINGERKRSAIAVTWDEILAVIGPSLFQMRMSRGYDGRFEFEKPLHEFIREKPGFDDAASIKLSTSSMDSLLFQFKQLGLMMIQTTREGKTWWTLTPKGEARVTKLLVATK